MKYTWYDFAGNVGVALMVLVYLLLQVGKVRSGDLRYSAMNAVGAALVLVSLFFVFNLSAFLVEGFWLVISLFGLIKYLSKLRAAD
jgi:paired small multidrug resistance pump